MKKQYVSIRIDPKQLLIINALASQCRTRSKGAIMRRALDIGLEKTAENLGFDYRSLNLLINNILSAVKDGVITDYDSEKYLYRIGQVAENALKFNE